MRPETVASGFTLPSPEKGRLHASDVVQPVVESPEKQRWMFDAENFPRDA